MIRTGPLAGIPSAGRQGLRLPALLAVLGLAVVGGCREAPDLPPDGLLPHARSMQQAGHFEDSIAPLQGLLQVDPQHLEARRLLALAYLQTGDGAAAASHLERALKAGAQPGPIKPLQARALVLQEAYEQAIEVITADDLAQADIGLLLTLAEAHLGLEQADAARQLLEQVLLMDPRHDGARANLFRLTMGTGDHAQAAQHLARLPQDQLETWLFTGDLALATGDPQRAQRAYARVLEQVAEHAAATQGIAQAHLAAGDTATAREILNRVLATTPDDPNAHYLLAVAAYQDALRDEAVLHVRHTLSQIPVHGPALRLYGLLNIELRRYEQAAESLTRYLADTPEDTATGKLLAAVWLQLGQPWEADDVLDGLSGSGDDPVVTTLRGLSQLQRGDYAQAITLLKGPQGEERTDLGRALADGEPEPLAPTPPPASTQLIPRLLAGADAADPDLRETAALAQRIVDQPDDARAYVLLTERAVARGDITEACKLYGLLVARNLTAAAPSSLANLGCLQAGTVSEGLGDTLEADFRTEIDSLLRRVERALGSGGPSPPDHEALTSPLVATVLARQIREVGQVSTTAAPVALPLYQIPPALKDQLKALRDSLPQWLRELNDGPAAAGRRPQRAEADRDQDSQPMPLGAPLGADPPPPAEVLSEVAALGAALFGAFGWLAGLVRRNQEVALVSALLVGGALYFLYFLAQRQHRRAEASSHRRRSRNPDGKSGSRRGPPRPGND